MKRPIMTMSVTALAVWLAACEQQPAARSAAPAATQPPAPVAAGQAAPGESGQTVLGADSPQLAQVRTEPVQALAVPVGGVSVPGKVEANANRLSHVVLPVTGRVGEVMVQLGAFVQQGQPLLTLESADVDAAVSAYQQGQAAVTQARSALAKAQTDLDRQKDLFEHGAVPQKEVLNAQAVQVQAQAGLEQAQANVEQCRRKLQLLGAGTGTYGQRIVVHAPISGRVLEMSVVKGEFRNDLSAPLMSIADLSSVWVSSDVPETEIKYVQRGEPLQITLAAYPGEIFRGKVAQIADVVDPQTRTIKVRAELPNPAGRLKPEMFGTVQLAERSEMRPTVPASAVLAAAGKSLVWRQVQPGTFERVAVTTGPRQGNRLAILTGLTADDRVVVEGVMLLAAKQ